MPTTAELDTAFAAEVVASYSGFAGDGAVAADAQAGLMKTKVWEIMMKVNKGFRGNGNNSVGDDDEGRQRV